LKKCEWKKYFFFQFIEQKQIKIEGMEKLKKKDILPGFFESLGI